MIKNKIGANVLEASQDRINYIFDNFEKIIVSLSGGKDSNVMFNLVIDEAKRRNRKIALFILDWECQFQQTMDHIRYLYEENKEHIELYWVCLEIETNSSCSMHEPLWRSWDNEKKALWTREKPDVAIDDPDFFPFYYPGITFEEFVPLFAQWYAKEDDCACFVGIRAQESLNRFRAIARKDVNRFNDKKYTVKIDEGVYNVYPIYDWLVDDVWCYFYKTGKKYNPIYDRMYQAGLKISQMRIDEPFGEEARKNLWLYQIVEPITWSKFTARMAGVNSACLYSQEKGNILGNDKVSLPKGHTWESFCNYLLDSMPPFASDHYKDKIAVYLKWYQERGYLDGIPDEGYYRLEQLGKIPAWRQIAKNLLKNDWYCQTIGFGITKSSNYEKYKKLMAKRRKEWGIYSKSSKKSEKKKSVKD